MIYVKKSITEYLHGQNFDIKFLLFALLLRLCTQVTLKMHSFSAYQTCAIFSCILLQIERKPCLIQPDITPVMLLPIDMFW